MTPQDLERIYELTYKYGWLVSEERKEGWLPDQAYMEKAKIEGELNKLIDYGLEELVDAFERWSDHHGSEFKSLFEEWETEEKWSPTVKKEFPNPKIWEMIENIVNAYKRLIWALQFANLDEKIITFQLGLHTVHHRGDLVEYWVPGGKALLDKLSAGPDPQWDQDLERLFGHPIGAHLRRAIALIEEAM